MPKGRKGSLLVLQSGGPTHVINQSLAGVFHEAERSGAFKRVLGADHGPRGLIDGKFIDLSAQSKAVWRAVARTPGSALGTARRKITDEDLPAVFEALQAHNVTCLISIGGNDSAENARLFSVEAQKRDYPLTVMAVPKTVDNDLPATDHCPGFGSAARYLALATMSTARDAEAMGVDRPILVMEAMGRNAAWLAVSAGMGKREERDAPHAIVSPERVVHEDRFLALLEEAMTKFGHAVAVVAENAKGPDGPLGAGGEPDFVDEFGHAYWPSPAHYLSRLASRRLKVRANFTKPGMLARSMAPTVSRVDAREARMVGEAAVRYALQGESGKMVTLVRAPEGPYQCGVGLAPLEAVAGKERLLPEGFSEPVTEFPTRLFRDYARPLMGGPLPRFGRFR